MRPSTPYIIEKIKAYSGIPRVLDVGCGKGRETTKIKSACPHAVFHAVDSEHSNHFDDSILFKLGFIEDIPTLFPGEKYDFIIVQHVLEHIVYPDASMKVLASMLNPGGSIVVESPNWTRLIIPFHRHYFWNDPTHIRPFTKYSYEALCRASDLVPGAIYTKSSARFPALFSSLLASRSLGSFFKRLRALVIEPFLLDAIILVAIQEKNENKK
jgi:trans-aconitate methyltransferase